jgi:transcriptional regulator with XRE-family HTH domain
MNQDKDRLKTQILRKYLDGFSQEQIATELDISEGAVSEFLQESRQQDDTLIFQHEIAVICNKYNIPIRQLASNLAFANAPKGMAFDHNKINLLLRVLNKIVVEDGSFSPEKIGTRILQICSFMEANGSSLEEVHMRTEKKRKS